MPDKPQKPKPRTLYEVQVFYSEVLLAFIKEGVLGRIMPVVLCHEGKFYVIALNIAAIEHGDVSDETVLVCRTSYHIQDSHEVTDEISWGDVFLKTEDTWWETEI